MFGKRITEPGFADRPVYGRPFRIAMGAMGAIAFVELLAIGYGVLRRGPVGYPPSPPSGVVAPLPAAPVPAAPAIDIAMAAPASRVSPAAFDPASPPVIDPGSPEPRAQPAPEFPAPADPAAAPAVADPGSLFDALATAAAATPLENGILEALLTTGAQHRAKGNTQLALKNFREVESAFPDHPRILAEIAATLGILRLQDKAAGYWERVEALGSVGGGPYFPIAVRQLGGEAPGEAPADAAPKTMRIGEIKVEEQAPGTEGQKVSLAVTIDADPALRPAGDELSLLVYFFDRLSGGEVRPSTADTSYLYPTEPYDWQVDGTETILVNYHQPAFTEEQKRELGERHYHGYAIELYYRDELQDKVAMPEDVAALRFPVETVAPAPEPARQPAGPENVLFPDPAAP